jgi:hypothetical protein
VFARIGDADFHGAAPPNGVQRIRDQVQNQLPEFASGAENR